MGTSLGTQLQQAVSAVTTAYQTESAAIGTEIQAGLAAIAAAVANNTAGIDPTDAATITASITSLTALAAQMQTDTATLNTAFPSNSTANSGGSTTGSTVTVSAVATNPSKSKVASTAESAAVSALKVEPVAAGVPAKILLSPSGATIPLHTLIGGQQFTAKVLDAAGDDLHVGVTWGITPTTVAEISTGGMATAKGVGTATITAQVGALTAFASLVVT